MPREKTPFHRLSLEYQPRLDRYEARIRVGGSHKGARAESPDEAVRMLLALCSGWKKELEFRAFVSMFFKPWIEELAKDHKIPLSPATLSVVSGGRIHHPDTTELK